MKKLIFLFLLSLASSAFAQSDEQIVLKKITLMKYVAEEEAKYNHDYSLSSFRLPFIEEAYAYGEGSACLILGFQSTFKNGMCRLSKAEGAKEHTSSCKSGTLPCNPVVFGSNNGKPFCVSNYGGAELSRFCSHESFKYLAKSPEFSKFSSGTQEKLREIAKTPSRDFSFSQVKDLAKDPQLSKSFLSGYKSGLEDSKKFTESLCQSIQAAPKKTKAHELDIKNCQAQLDVLNQANVDSVKLVEEKQKKAKQIASSKEVVKNKVSINNEDKQCVPPKSDVIEEEKIKVIQKVPEMMEVTAWNECVKELYNHKNVQPESRGKYYHDLAGEKYFGKQCFTLDNYGEKEMIYSFISDSGFKVMKFPVYTYKESGVEATLPRNIFRFKAKGKNYLLSQFDNLGEYFDSLPEERYNAFLKENDIMGNPANMKKRYIDAYENYLSKIGTKTPELVDPSDDGVSLKDAQSCLKERLVDYVSMVWYKTHPEALPYTNTLNADLARSDKKTPELQARYGKTVDEIKGEMGASLFPEGSSCRNVMTAEDLDKAFERNYGSRVGNYEKYRQYFIP